MEDKQLSKNFWMSEMLRSRQAALHGIPMAPSGQVVLNYEWGAQNILQPTRDVIGPMIPTSGWRSELLNTLIGGHPLSFHLSSRPGIGAVDFVAVRVSLVEAMQAMIDLKLPFRKLILEFNQWIHVSWDSEVPPRRRVLTALMENGKRVYKPGIVV